MAQQCPSAVDRRQMEIKPETRRRIQIVLAAAIVIAGVRALIIYRARHAARNQGQLQMRSGGLDPDYYVIPKKLHPYDLKSARELTKQPVWVKEGYRYAYYPYDPKRHRTDFSHQAGWLLPIEKLEIKDVVTDVSPGSSDQRQVMAIFQKEGKNYAFPIGAGRNGDYQIYSDEMLYIQDPHELYHHWPSDVWDAIAQHQVKPGMNELQADFAIGMGVPQKQDNPQTKVVDYPNGGKPLQITYQNGKAELIKPGPAS